MVDKTGIGDRMKQFYEDPYRIFLPRRSNVIIRLDGKCFHSLTKDAEKPFDAIFMNAMQYTAERLCQEVQGCKFAFVQSDEISLWLTDYDNLNSDAWFKNNLQKMCSISAAIASIAFSEFQDTRAILDSRVFVIPSVSEVINYFIWRQQDATRNSINMVGQSLYSTKELHGKNVNEVQEMIFEKGKNWNDYPVACKRGSCFKYQQGEWELIDPPIFTDDREFIRDCIKDIEL